VYRYTYHPWLNPGGSVDSAVVTARPGRDALHHQLGLGAHGAAVSAMTASDRERPANDLTAFVAAAFRARRLGDIFARSSLKFLHRPGGNT
jgi:hypothetical protein